VCTGHACPDRDGNITGIVTDSSGAIIAGASVVARNLNTGVASPTTTNSAGFYSLQFLPIGHYQVTVQATGFGETILPFSLEILQAANFNVHMKIGSVAETVEVSTAGPILNTNDATPYAT
jgi:Carboxypeptidase regulatory-like domain